MVVGGVILIGGTATLIWALVKRGADKAVPAAPAVTAPLAGSVAVPAGARIAAASLAGTQLTLLGEVAGQGQFVLVVDAATGARRQLLQLVPDPR